MCPELLVLRRIIIHVEGLRSAELATQEVPTYCIRSNCESEGL
jgi:hypothetical protein